MIDSSIALGYKPPQFESPVNSLAAIMQLQGAQQANQLNGMKMDEYKRGVAGDNVLAQLLAGGKTGADVATGLASQGYGQKSLDYTKAQTAQVKEQAAAEKDRLANTHAKLSLGAQLLSSATDQTSYDASRATAQANGLDVSRMPAQFDPAFVASKLQESQTIKEQLEQKWKAMEFSTPNANAVLSARTSAGNNAATVGATMRGQDMTSATAAAGLDQRASQFDQTLEAGKKQVLQSDNGPVLVNTKTGEGQIINGPDGKPLAGVTKPLNDSQSKALLFGSRMREADKVMGTLSGEGKVNSLAGSRAPVVGGVINAISSDNNQMLNQAKTDFMTAVLRRESGAAISSGEFDTADKQYFPQVGDAPGVIAQKAANRQLAIQGILMEVPEKQRGSLQAGPAPQGKPDAAGMEAELRKRGLIK